MKVAVSGSSGLVGRALCDALRADGHEVLRLVRREARKPDEVRFEVHAESVDRERLAAAEAVVHLAGHPIAAGRWNDEERAKIERSRVRGTRVLAEALAALPPRPFVCASAVGWYGDRGDAVLSEDEPAGEGFLARVCREWEAACEPARAAGCRVVNLRFGMILSEEGGALPRMLTPFKLGAGGPVGDGTQWWSWIALDDAVGAIRRALEDEGLSGPVNAVSPSPVTSRDFARILGRVLRRPAVLPLPAFAARLALGGMADDLLLASARVDPRRLREAGYAFREPDLEPALRRLLA